MLPSDPEHLLEYMENVCSDSSDDEFDGYLSDEHSANIDDSGGDGRRTCVREGNEVCSK